MLGAPTLGEHLAKIRSTTKKCVVGLSGGLDSTTLVHLMVRALGKDNVVAISYDYNQRHSIELTYAKKTAEALGIKHIVQDISFLGEAVKGVSAMVKGDIATPTLEENLGDPQPVTYVPYRNMILFSLNLMYAESVGADSVALGVQAVDSYQYWDCDLEFADRIQSVVNLNRKHDCSIITPFVSMNKAEEIQLGIELDVNYSLTNTCYNPNDKDESCGICPSCKERISAFNSLGIVDPIKYQIDIAWS